MNSGCRTKEAFKEKYSLLSEKTIKMLLPFPITGGKIFFICFNQNNIITEMNTQINMRIQLLSIIPGIKEICKNVKMMPLFSLNFVLEHSYFS